MFSSTVILSGFASSEKLLSSSPLVKVSSLLPVSAASSLSGGVISIKSLSFTVAPASTDAASEALAVLSVAVTVISADS